MSRTASILVVEDEPLVAIELAALLRAAGWDVAGPAGTLTKAIELARSALCDCALLDINLKGERIDDVAAILAERGIPFVFATGYGRESLPAAFRNNAVIIPKPFNNRAVVQTIRNLLRE